MDDASAMTLDPFTLAGILGTAVIIVAYFGNQQGWLKGEDWKFPLANLIGSLLIMLSLVTAWNLPVAVVETSWVAISIYGLIRHSARSKRS
jgi:Na+-translocating ferredoxin:NAD+ oxidoreductase RnfD subunit